MPRCIDGSGKVIAPQSREEAHQRSRLRWVQCIAVGWHISSALQHLADDLVLRHAACDGIQCRAAKAAGTADGVTVAALLVLQDEGSLPFQRGAVMQVSDWNGIARPRIHDRTPRGVHAKARKDTQP